MTKRSRDLDEIKRKKMARLRFYNLVRSVVLNRIWLMDAGEQKLSLNVKKNIALLVRTQPKIGLLTMTEKSIIRTDHSLRTVEEKKKLVSLMTSLNCFAKIPPKVLARLSKCVKFMVISPGRKLIKEGDTSTMLFFILTGEVEVSKSLFDHVKNCWMSNIEKLCGPGDCVGDVELIERSKRRHTYTTSNVVELLVVFEEDFERELRPVMEKQWSEKLNAIMVLDYFKFLTTEQISSACKLCVIRQFEPMETIYYEDSGQLSYVHFVISGECMILQCLKMIASQKEGVRSFKLTDLHKEDSFSLFKDMPITGPQKLLIDENYTEKKSGYAVAEIIPSDAQEGLNKITKQHSCSGGKIENHFIDVGSLTFGGVFGLGEKLEHRVIMARTTVQCLMLPRFWLLQKYQNPGNIWQRRRFYLENTTPSRSTLFKDFLNTHQWQKFKSHLIETYLDKNSISNPTRIQDIPIICRIIEAHDK